MRYRFSNFLLDTHRKTLVVFESNLLVTDNERNIQLLELLIKAHPDHVSKQELMDLFWPEGTFTEWALSRLIADIRQLMSAHDSEERIIKTVHRKGFRMAVEVHALTDEVPDKTVEIPSTIVTSTLTGVNSSRFAKKKNAKVILLIALAFVIFFGTYYWHRSTTSWKSEEQLAQAEDYKVPMQDHWWSTSAEAIHYTEEGVVVTAEENLQMFGFVYSKPTYIRYATFEMRIKVDEDFLQSDLVLQPFAQVEQRGNWSGDWNCSKIRDQLSRTDYVSIKCTIRSFNIFWKQNLNESTRFGIKLEGLNPRGKIYIQSASLHIPSHINLDKDWVGQVEYDHGVSYKPRATNENLYRSYKGPIDLRGKTLIYSLLPDKKFIDSGASIQPYLNKLYEHRGMWACHMNNPEFKVGGITIQCPTLSNEEIYLLSEKDYLMIGVQPYGDSIDGQLKIIGISVLTPEELEAVNPKNGL